MPAELHDNIDDFVQHLLRLPPGLRAMAATFQLDVSMALDDLGWHFANWHHKPYCEETLRGLQLLNAREAAEIFSVSYELVLPHWEEIGNLIEDDFHQFIDWYSDSELENSLEPLNQRMWEIRDESKEYGLMQYWLTYARKYPENILAGNS